MQIGTSQKLGIVLNHSIDVFQKGYYIPRAEAEFVNQLSPHFCDTGIVGFLSPGDKSERNHRFDGKLSGSSISILLDKTIPPNYDKKTKIFKWKHYTLSMKSVAKLIRKFDIWYVFLPGYIGFLTCILCVLLKRKYGVYVRGEWRGYPWLVRLMHLYSVRHAEFAIVTGLGFLRRLKSIQPNIEPVSPMISFSLEGQRFDRNYTIGDTIKLLFVGTLIEEKGIFDLLKSLQYLNRNPQGNKIFKLRVIGTGTKWVLEKCKKLINDLKIAEFVTFGGYINDPNSLLEEYLDADIFVFPSYYGEGFPRVIYEAMLTGLPVIGTYLAGIQGTVLPEENFLPILPKNPLNIAEKISMLARDKTYREKIGKNGQKLVEDIFDYCSRGNHAEQVILNVKQKITSQRI